MLRQSGGGVLCTRPDSQHSPRPSPDYWLQKMELAFLIKKDCRVFRQSWPSSSKPPVASCMMRSSGAAAAWPPLSRVEDRGRVEVRANYFWSER
jgi:hypothetical protein